MHIKLKSNLSYNIEKTSDEDELQEKQRGIIQQISPNFEIPEPQYWASGDKEAIDRLSVILNAWNEGSSPIYKVTKPAK